MYVQGWRKIAPGIRNQVINPQSTFIGDLTTFSPPHGLILSRSLSRCRTHNRLFMNATHPHTWLIDDRTRSQESPDQGGIRRMHTR